MKVASFNIQCVNVPVAEPHRTASGVVSASPLVLLTETTDTGVKGHSIVFTYTPAALKPTAAIPGSWLEYADWWNPVLRDPLVVTDGRAVFDGVIGSGIEFNDSAVQRLLV